MVDPYEFLASPPAMKSKRTRRKSITKTTKKRKSNEKPPHVSIRQANTNANIRTRSNKRDADQFNDVHEKENNPNQGFTQLIQTKMMEVKKRQSNRKNKKVNIIVDDQRSSSATRKRQLSDHDDDDDDFITVTNEKEDQNNNLPLNTIDEHATTITTITCHPRCELKDHHLVPANKRRRACLCSKRQLYELEFAPDSAPSQSQHVQDEEQQPPQEESHLEAPLPSVNQSPLPLLLPTSTLTFVLPPIASITIEQSEETNDKERLQIEQEEEKELQLDVPSIIAAPLSPAMPLNSTYIAHRTNPIVTQVRHSIFDLTALTSVNTTTTTVNTLTDISPHLCSSIIQTTNLEPKQIDQQPSILVSVESITTRQDQETSMTPPPPPPPPTVQTMQCSVSTQTDIDYQPTHHHCNDVSICPCVQTYTRSEQLFMTSMAVFFRNSITITPSEPSDTVINHSVRRTHKKHRRNQQNKSAQSSPIIGEIEQNNNVGINETYVIDNQNNNNNNNNTVATIEPEHQLPPPPLPVDTSTVINETRIDNTKKSDGSSIQINIHEEKSSNDRQKFRSIVLTMTALKNEQKIVFNRFLEHFSVRSSPIIDDTTTHLITDEDPENSLKCPLTGKVLQAVARHLPIVSYRWLTACLTKQRYIDAIPTYEILGDAIYSQHHGMSRSRLNHSNDYRLFANYAFHLKCHGCQPFTDNRPLIELINLSGGLILKTLNQHIDNVGRQIVILCSKNYLQNKSALEQACQKFNIRCIEPEWLIASIVKFEIQPFEPWLCTLYS